MSIPTEKELEKLKEAELNGDSELFHCEFDDAVEKKLMEFDPEWMKWMNDYYNKSHMSRWYA
jgi:hypothetical protein